jgi:hypothetical protein
MARLSALRLGYTTRNETAFDEEELPMPLPPAEGGTGSLNAAALAERQRLMAAQAAERQRLQNAAKHMGGEDKADMQKSIDALKPGVVAKDTFVNQAQVGATKDARQALYEKFNTDGQDGLSDAEFDAAFAG